MPRNHRTKNDRKIENARIAKRQRELEQLAEALEEGNDETVIPVIDDTKHRNTKHKPRRFRSNDGRTA